MIPTLIHVLAAAALLGAVAFGRLSAVVLRTGRFEDRAQLAWLIMAGAGAVLCALQASAAALAVLRGS